MAHTAQRLMEPNEFFAWQSGQDELYELVDGLPVPGLKMMTGASARHDRVVVNAIVTLGNQLRGSRCRPTTDDLALRTRSRTLRRTDVMVECGDLVPDSYEALNPRLVIEVLSPSTMGIDRIRKLEEYKAVPSLAYILLVETRSPTVTLYTRTPGGDWTMEDVTGLDGRVLLPELRAELAMSDLYEGLSFAPP